MSLLTNDWGYTVNAADFNPNDPLVNTASEYMYQMATIAHHTLTGTTTVVLDKDVDVARHDHKAGTYEFVDRRPLLDRLRPDQPDRGCRPRAAVDRHHARADRRARRRQRHRLGPPDRPRRGRHPRRLRRHDPPHRPRPGVGDASRDRAGQGSGPPDRDRLDPTGRWVPHPAIQHHRHAGSRARRVGFSVVPRRAAGRLRRHAPRRRRSVLLELPPAAGPIVGDDLSEHRQQGAAR